LVAARRRAQEADLVVVNDHSPARRFSALKKTASAICSARPMRPATPGRSASTAGSRDARSLRSAVRQSADRRTCSPAGPRRAIARAGGSPRDRHHGACRRSGLVGWRSRCCRATGARQRFEECSEDLASTLLALATAVQEFSVALGGATREPAVEQGCGAGGTRRSPVRSRTQSSAAGAEKGKPTAPDGRSQSSMRAFSLALLPVRYRRAL
jgi:hypothetical protein